MPKQAPSKSKKSESKKPVPPKSNKTTRDIPLAAKNKRSSTMEEEDDLSVLRKLRPHLPLHNDAH